LQKRYLICPLHWGLGHATRCIPIVRSLLADGHIVYIASDGGALLLLQKEFPTLRMFELPSYNIEYRYESMLWNMALQSGRFYKAMSAEHSMIQNIVNQCNIDIIISDNRYGCWAKNTSEKRIENIFITHQINIQTGFSMFDTLARWVNHSLIRRFDKVWIPDFEQETESLAGSLSHGHAQSLPPIEYMGALSRFEPKTLPIEYDIAVILSGPEPQRTFLEQELIPKLIKKRLKSILIQGILNESQPIQVAPNLKIMPYLTADALNDLICSSQLIVCRSGYTTIMDLAALQKKALMIPTPGQTEQEYLAYRLASQGRCWTQKQAEIELDFLF
jgi:uncharacterized protein (TIGR00661 family)